MCILAQIQLSRNESAESLNRNIGTVTTTATVGIGLKLSNCAILGKYEVVFDLKLKVASHLTVIAVHEISEHVFRSAGAQ